MRLRSKFWLVLLLVIAARAGTAADPEASYRQGEALGRAGDYARALPWIRQAAESGHAQAQFTLGSMYAFGQGVDESKATARAWYEKAAAQHHPRALFNLGLYHDRGIGVAEDRPRALMFYKLGALAGDGQASYNAGQLLVLGDGVQADAREGLRYFRIAADLAIPQAQMALGWVHERAIGVDRDVPTALDWYARAEAGGLEKAVDLRIALARRVNDEALAIERDGHALQALAQFDLACRHAEYNACYNAGRMRYSGKTVAKDLVRARPDLAQACRWAIGRGCLGLVGLLMQSVPLASDDLALLRKFMSETCELGDQQSCFYFAWMKTQGQLGMYDPGGAQKLLAQACMNHGYEPACGPWMAMYNASLPQSSGNSGSGEMNILEKGILGVLGVIAGLGSAGQVSSGSYSGASSYSPPAYSAPSGGYSPQDNADFQQFIQSVSSYGTPGNCRAGNPYC
ncbi:MAG: sel1 repeat family protein [Rhodanobacteraceae bacterium]|nr:sel1 repeat family protein [Rhodanobacteraceae bacterium]